MNLTAIFLCFTVLSSIAANNYSQTTEITVEFEQTTVKEVLNYIEANSEFKFFYSSSVDVETQIISISKKDKKIFEILDELFENMDVRYEIMGRQIALVNNNESYAFTDEQEAQQQKTVTGVVKDEEGEPIPGVTVLEKGTNNGTITDIDGAFRIPVSDDAVLEISFVGYISQEIAVDDQTDLSITLEPDFINLEDVVVVGYGTMRKKDLTGSITQIDPGKLENENPKTVQDVLRGTPGLNVGFNPSAKGGGTMQIRGQRSVYDEGGHNNPLIVLDGMIFHGELSEINPDDISQIDVLKDASAAAVYGARAANGVIIITTKKGKKGEPKINFSSSVGFVTMGMANREVYGPDGYLEFYEDWYKTPTYGLNEETGNYEAYQASRSNEPGYFDYPSQENLNKYGITLEEWRGYVNSPEGTPDGERYLTRLRAEDKTVEGYLNDRTFDWYDHTFRTGLNQDYNLSVSGANENLNYYMSLGYMDNEGLNSGNNYNTIRSNLKLEGTVNERLTVGANVNFQNRTDLDLAADWRRQILENSPYAAYTDSAGNLDPHPMRDAAYGVGYNYDFDRQYQALERGYIVLNTILTAQLELPFNITYSFNVSPRYQFFHDRYFESAQHPDWSGTNGLVNREQARRFDWSLNNRINWEKTFADRHRVNLTLVHEAEELQYWQDRIEARDINPTDALGFHETENANVNESSFDSEDTRETADGMLARLFYNFDERYMITGSVRRDGYSAFGTSNPRATFYSVAGAWTFTNENFFDWQPMSNGKIRLSWGQNGNRSLEDPYLALANLVPSVGTQAYSDGSGGIVERQILRVNRLANPTLQWEKTTAFNVGMDLGFINNRFSATLDYYIMPTTDMVMQQSLPGFTGFGSITTNLGEVENKGFELLLTSRNIENENFLWNTTVGFSYYENTIKHLYYRYETILDEEGNVIETREVDDIDNRWFIGQPISTIWDYRVTGIWQEDEIEEADLYNQDPGDPKVANNYYSEGELDEDGNVVDPEYTNEDREFLGQTAPPIHWSLRNDFTIYKNFNLSINIYSYWGHKSLSGNYLNRENNLSQIDNNFNVYKREYWTPDNPTNEYARLNASGPSTLDYPQKLHDRSFIRLDNISLGYTLPQKFTARWGVEQLKIYANIRNVAVWAKDWEYWDPETDYDFGDSAADNAREQLAPRTYTIGLNLTL